MIERAAPTLNFFLSKYLGFVQPLVDVRSSWYLSTNYAQTTTVKPEPGKGH